MLTNGPYCKVLPQCKINKNDTNCTMCLKRFLWWSGGRGGLTAGSRAGAV